MRSHILRRRPRNLGPLLSRQPDRSPAPQQQIVLQLMEQYDQYQLYWHHALRLNPPDCGGRRVLSCRGTSTATGLLTLVGRTLADAELQRD